jgi:long-chain fatty acid transport protein
MMKKTGIRLVVCWVMVSFAARSHATLGMNMEGYGPISLAMGGISMAYDNGNAAFINNPATLTLMPPQTRRADLALGYLGPDISATYEAPDGTSMRARSKDRAFFMPAFGYSQRGDRLAYGFGVYAQGGMGTEYGADTFMAAGSGERVRSEVSLGRAIFPLAYQVNERLHIGGTFDFVWAGMDIQMAMSTDQGMQMMCGGSGMLFEGMPAMMAAMNPQYMRVDFSNGNPFVGEARGYGVGGKIGAVYALTDAFNVGAVYHPKTMLQDLKADSATLTMGTPGQGANVVDGSVVIKDFQWPAQTGIGLAWQPDRQWMLGLDYRFIQWSEVMKEFRMTFKADMGGGEVQMAIPQEWKDQHAVQVGAQYTMDNGLALRAGYAHANNPVPDTYCHPLFPAIMKSHFTGGFGYAFSPATSLDLAVSYAPEVKARTPNNTTITHSQINAQVMMSFFF